MIYLIVLLALVDVAALTIGISIRHKVTRLVTDTAGRIETAVKDGIDRALDQLTQREQIHQ